MRIKVTTSINVRSNTVPSSPSQAIDAFPPLPEKSRIIVEKVRSTAPLPLLFSQPNMATSRFMASQRPPRGSRLSAWIHGISVVNEDRGRASTHNRNTSHTSTYCYSRTPRRRSQDRVTGLRPLNSTRGVIDPEHSPTRGTFPFLAGAQLRDHERPLQIYSGNSAGTYRDTGHAQVKSCHRRTRTKSNQKKGRKTSLANTSDPKVRQKIIGSFAFGTILAILLIICTLCSFHAPSTFPLPTPSSTSRLTTQQISRSQSPTPSPAQPSTPSSSSSSSSSP